MLFLLETVWSHPWAIGLKVMWHILNFQVEQLLFAMTSVQEYVSIHQLCRHYKSLMV